MSSKAIFQIIVFAFVVTVTESQDRGVAPSSPLAWNMLVPDSASMARAWEFPRDPRVDTAGLDPVSARKVLRGFELFINTSKAAPKLSGGAMTCNNCHPNGGQREKALPLIGVDRVFPEYNKRAGRVFSLEDRIVGCFTRSINATGSKKKRRSPEETIVSSESEEVTDLAEYIRWLSRDRPIDGHLPWRGLNTLPESSLVRLEKMNPKLGRKIFLEKCSNCHGVDGQGIYIGDKRPGPLWGPDSWNDGAGAARTYTLAGMIRYMMPYMDPGSLTDEEAQHLAAFITSQQRPGFPHKDKDYLKEKIPTDAVYYKQLYRKNPLSSK